MNMKPNVKSFIRPMAGYLGDKWVELDTFKLINYPKLTPSRIDRLQTFPEKLKGVMLYRNDIRW